MFIGSGPGPPGHPGMTAASGKMPGPTPSIPSHAPSPGRRSTIGIIGNHSPALRGGERSEIDAFYSSSSRRRPGIHCPTNSNFSSVSAITCRFGPPRTPATWTPAVAGETIEDRVLPAHRVKPRADGRAP